ncbi:MAG: 2Fe-2S iron-sulfur cluster-binding protein [Pseudomonas sp.]
MNAFKRFKYFHWLLAGFFAAVYLTGDDFESVHIWLGYGLLVLLSLRLLLAPLRLRGFPRLAPPLREWRKPRWTGASTWLTFAMLLSFSLTAIIGLGMIDNGKMLSNLLPGVSADIFGTGGGEFLAGLKDADDVHEFFANLALGLIGLHIAYVLLFRWPMVLPMLRGLPGLPGRAPGTPSTVNAANTKNTTNASHTSNTAVTATPVTQAKNTATAAPGFEPLRLIQRTAQGADACSFEFSLPARLYATFAGKPGQFLTLKVPCAEPPLLRCYSLSRLPQPGQPLRITVKRVAGGRASNWLLDHLQPGASLEALPPAGKFTCDTPDQDLLLVGAGSGITPLFALLEAALQQGRARVRLFYANRDQDSVIFAVELAELQRRYAHRLSMVHWLDQQQGFADSAAIAREVEPFSHAECFVCGPPPFMRVAAEALALLEVPAQRIHLERFVTSTEPAQGQLVAQMPSGLSSDRSNRSSSDLHDTAQNKRPSRLQVSLFGQRHQLEVQPGEVLLEAMEQAGLQPPNACRAGVCAHCKCRVVAGQASMRSNQALSEREVNQGWILACQAEATSAELEVAY